MSNKGILDKEISRKSFLMLSGTTVGGVLLFNNYYQHKTERAMLAGPVEKEKLKEVKTFCFMCANYCGLKIFVDNEDRIRRVEPNKKHLGNAGGVCGRAHASIQQLYDPDRLKAPMRKIGEDAWEEITWDEAFDIIYEELTKIKDKYGPESVAFMYRRSPYWWAFNGFARNYGSPNTEGASSICDGAKIVGNLFAVGSHPLLGDFENAKYILLAGATQMEAPRYRLRHARETALAHERGAILTVVDPRFSYTSAKADNYLSIKPGTDAMLFLSMARVIIDEKLYDEQFINRYGQGFEEFKEEISKDMYKPENAAKITGLNPETIVKTAREFATNLPAIADSSSGIHKWTNGTINHWAMLCLNALVGCIDVKGGYTYTRTGRLSWPTMQGNQIKAKRHYEEGGWSFHENVPLDNKALITRAIVEPKNYPAGPNVEGDTISLYRGNGIRSVFLYNTDPLAAHSNTTLTKEAMAKLDFAVGIDIYLNQTMAHFPVGSIALPECTFYERWSATSSTSHKPFVALGQKVIEPLWNSKSSYWILTKLGKKFGYVDFAMLNEDNEENMVKRAVTRAIQPDGSQIDWEQIKEDGVWVMEGETKFKDYSALPNGKFPFALVGELTELQEAIVKASGVTVPKYLENLQTSKEKPLRLFAGGKSLWHTQGATRNLPYLVQNFHELATMGEINYINIHTSDAIKRGIVTGDRIKIVSSVGEVVGEARVTERVQPGLLQLSHGFGNESKALTVAFNKGINPNYVLNDMRWDKVSGLFTPNEEVCEVYKV